MILSVIRSVDVPVSISPGRLASVIAAQTSSFRRVHIRHRKVTTVVEPNDGYAHCAQDASAIFPIKKKYPFAGTKIVALIMHPMVYCHKIFVPVKGYFLCLENRRGILSMTKRNHDDASAVQTLTVAVKANMKMRISRASFLRGLNSS
jgi:hypothetical protein